MPLPDHARCLGCGYPLRGLGSRRCPECGREFDADDLRTVNLGRVPGRVGRALLRPSGWRPTLVAVAAAIAMLSATGLPRAVDPRLADTYYLVAPTGLEHRRIHSAAEGAYVASVYVVAGMSTCPYHP